MILNLPDEMPKPSRFSHRLVSNVWKSTSDFDAATQTYQSPGSRWEFTATWNILNRDEAGIVDAFVAELDGMANRVMLFDLANPEPAGNLRGAPKVNGANQVGRTLTLSNAEPGHTLKRGDTLGIACVNHDMLVKITRDSIAQADGSMVINFAPALPSAAVNQSIVEWDRPKAKFMLSGEAPGLNDISNRMITDLTLTFIQDITS